MLKVFLQLIKFGLVGVVATLIDTVIYVGLIALGSHYQLANIMGFTVSLFFNYIMSMKFVFESKYSKKERYKEQFIFVLLSLIGFLWSAILLKVLIEMWQWNPMISKGVTIIIVIVWNFVTRKLFLEKSVKMI